MIESNKVLDNEESDSDSDDLSQWNKWMHIVLY